MLFLPLWLCSTPYCHFKKPFVVRRIKTNFLNLSTVWSAVKRITELPRLQSSKFDNDSFSRISDRLLQHQPNHSQGQFNNQAIGTWPSWIWTSFLCGRVCDWKTAPTEQGEKGERNQELQALLQNMKSSEPNNYISARARGGLVTPCNDLVELLKLLKFPSENMSITVV